MKSFVIFEHHDINSLKMRFILFSIIVFFSFTSIHAQELIVDSGVVLKKGVYKTFEEFKYNSPSLDYSGEVVNHTVNYGLLGVGGSITQYELSKSFDDDYKTASIYGFCDGKSVYYNTNFSITSKANFVKIGYLGRYCHLEYVAQGNAYTSPGMNGGISITKVANRRSEAIIDINNGRFYDLSTSDLAELFDNYSLDKVTTSNGVSSYKNSVINYSKENIDEINREPALTKKGFEEFIYRLPTDITVNEYIDRLSFLKTDSRFREIKLIKKSYGSGLIKSVGVKASHSMSFNTDYLYQIGTWYYYYKNGKVAAKENYNLNGEKNGIQTKYNEKGEVIKELLYNNGKLVSKK